MKTLILFFLLLSIKGYAIDKSDLKIKFYGDTNISHRTKSSIDTNLYIEYNMSLYEPSHKKWGLFLAGKVNPTYDHLGNEIKTDVFTVLGIDF
jgi:hypothetical protein